jgi:hypothetical protein
MCISCSGQPGLIIYGETPFDLLFWTGEALQCEIEEIITAWAFAPKMHIHENTHNILVRHKQNFRATFLKFKF